MELRKPLLAALLATWNGHRHVWHRGHWMDERHGYAWAPHRWEHRGDRWYMSDGHWERRY